MSKSWKDYTFLEKVGAALLVSPLLVVVTGAMLIGMVLYDGFIFQQIWNLLIPQLFKLPQLSLVGAIAISLIIGYHQIRKRTIPNSKIDWAGIVISPLIFWGIAWIISNYFI